MKKFKKSKYGKDSLLLKLIYLADNKLDDEEKIPTRADYVEKREIDRSTLYSFDGPLQLIHADIGNLKFLGKSATTSRYVFWLLTFIPQKYMFILCIRENKIYKTQNNSMIKLKIKEIKGL